MDYQTSLSNASSPPKLTRHQLAVHLALSLRYVDELTRNGILPYFKIGKSIRYELAEVEAVLRDRFHIQPKARKPARAGTNSQA